jgi:hypothetical protein
VDRFWLGTHRPEWLAVTDVPLFVSRRRLAGRKTLPRARGPVAIDSGGFSELSLYGRWETPAHQYVAEARRFVAEIGNVAWLAIQDWMCEPHLLKKTGLSVAEHQARTIASYLELMSRAPELPWTPVLQGWERDDYHRHIDAYGRAGVDLRALPIVGIGSVCRRQATSEIVPLVRSVARAGVRLHGFGVKVLGLRQIADDIASADSMAWSFEARRQPVLLPGCTSHINCANCLRWALLWRDRVLDAPSQQPSAYQLDLFGGAA